ncbi:MAG TPA: CpaF family protein [archaeon]|nr:CpaF family protein [archaeon]
MPNLLGFACGPDLTGYFSLPSISESDAHILTRFVELFGKSGETDLIDRLLKAAEAKQLGHSETVIRFWAPHLVGGKLGPLEPLLADPSIEEIMVNGIDQPVFVYSRQHGMLPTPLSFTDPSFFLEISNRILSGLGRRVDASHPRANGMLESGDRVAVIIPPYSRDYLMDIRRFTAEPLTILDLVSSAMLDSRTAAFLWLVMEAGNLNVGVVGNTGSGKTTLLNTLTRFIPEHERLVLVEEVPEIVPLHSQVVHLVSADSLGITLRDAIIDSLRLRPGRVIVGEVRSDEEVQALRESCLAGQALGTYFTYHGQSAGLARRRLEAQGFAPHDLDAIDLLVVCRRLEQKGRAIRRVVELSYHGTSLSAPPKSWPEIPELTRVFGDWQTLLERRARLLASGKLSGKDSLIFKEIQKAMA